MTGADRVGRRPVKAGVVLSAILLTVAAGVSRITAQEPTRPRIGLVLSGGAARGAAHVGVLKVLEELRVPVDAVIGTSMGAIVGGLFASGLDADELERELLRADWPAIFRDEVPRRSLSFRRKEEQRQPLLHQEVGVSLTGPELPGGLVAGHRLGVLLETLLLPVLDVRDFDRLPIPFRATATDIGTGELVVLGRGEVARAIRASMAVPAAFTPVEYDGHLLVDGGLVDNLPLDVADELDLDVVIAVDVVSDLQPADSLESLIGIARQVTRIVVRANSERALADHDPALLIQPDLTRFSAIDFPSSEDMIEQGRQAARQHADVLRRWSVPEGRYEAWRRSVRDRRPATVVPAFVRVDGPDRSTAEHLERRLRTRAGVPVDTAVLRRDLNRIYGLGGYDRVGVGLVGDGGRVGLEIRPVPRATGPAVAQIGLQLSDDFGGRGTFTAVARLVRLRLTGAGGELRLLGALGEDRSIALNLYQPLHTGSRAFIELDAEHRRAAPRLPAAGGRVPYFDRRTRLAAGVGVHVGTSVEATTGVELGHVLAEPDQAAADSLPAFTGWQGGLFARLALDRLDDAELPRHGVLASAELFAARAALGETADHARVSADLTWALTRGRHTVLVGAAGGARLSGELPFHDRFRLGGFLRLSGLPPYAITGEEMAMGRMLYLRTVGRAGVVRIGGGLEAGDAWTVDQRPTLDRFTPSALALVGARTLLGAVHLAVGWAEGGRWAGHLLLGTPPY